jgi:hypothetical protein
MKIIDKRLAVYGCKACGFAFKADGGAYVANAKELKDYFRGGTLAHQTLTEAMAGEQLNPATKILLQARLVEYGTQMWFDGLKQGLVMGAATSQTLEQLARAVAEDESIETRYTTVEELTSFLNGGKPT